MTLAAGTGKILIDPGSRASGYMTRFWRQTARRQLRGTGGFPNSFTLLAQLPCEDSALAQQKRSSLPDRVGLVWVLALPWDVGGWGPRECQQC